MQINSRIYVAGHLGLAGSAIYRALKKSGYHNLITRSHSELELLEKFRKNPEFASVTIKSETVS